MNEYDPFEILLKARLACAREALDWTIKGSLVEQRRRQQWGVFNLVVWLPSFILDGLHDRIGGFGLVLDWAVCCLMVCINWWLWTTMIRRSRSSRLGWAEKWNSDRADMAAYQKAKEQGFE